VLAGVSTPPSSPLHSTSLPCPHLQNPFSFAEKRTATV
jgi:hypothetical protein